MMTPHAATKLKCSEFGDAIIKHMGTVRWRGEEAGDGDVVSNHDRDPERMLLGL